MAKKAVVPAVPAADPVVAAEQSPVAARNDAAPTESAILARTDLAKVESAMVQFDATEAGLADLRAKYKDIVFEKIETVAGMKVAVAARAAVRDPRIALEKIREEAKRPLLDLGKSLDNRAREIKAALLELEEPMAAQIKAEDDRKEAEKAARERAARERLESIHATINEIRAVATDAVGLTSSQITDLAIMVAMTQPAEAVFAEFLVNAQLAVHETAMALRKLAADSLAKEEEAAQMARDRAELDELRALQAKQKEEAAVLSAKEESDRKARLWAEDLERRTRQEAEDKLRREQLAKEEIARAAARKEEDDRLAARRAEIAQAEAELAERQRVEREAEERRQAEARARQQAEEQRLRREQEVRERAESLEREAREKEQRRLDRLAELATMYPYSERPGRALIESMGWDYLNTETAARNVADNAARVLMQAERFIAGFEDDDLQEGVRALLADIRALIPSTAIEAVAA